MKGPNGNGVDRLKVGLLAELLNAVDNLASVALVDHVLAR